jgi:septum formation protein
MDLVLASTSNYRKALLNRLGVSFRCVAPDVDEERFKGRGLDPARLAVELAIAKATNVAEREPAAIVIGGDQVAAIEERMLDKPETVERAIEQLKQLSGNRHRLFTAIAVRRGKELQTALDVTTLRMRSLTDEEIERYVAADRPLDCAGAYKIESRGIALFEMIESADYSAIEGLPLMALTTILRRFGLAIP